MKIKATDILPNDAIRLNVYEYWWQVAKTIGIDQKASHFLLTRRDDLGIPITARRSLPNKRWVECAPRCVSDLLDERSIVDIPFDNYVFAAQLNAKRLYIPERFLSVTLSGQSLIKQLELSAIQDLGWCIDPTIYLINLNTSQHLGSFLSLVHPSVGLVIQSIQKFNNVAVTKTISIGRILRTRQNNQCT